MRFKLVFQGNGNSYPDAQDMVNSFFHRMLGDGNRFHDTFSNYSLSNLMGGRITDGKLVYDGEAYVILSTSDGGLLSLVMEKVFDIRSMHMRDMKGKRVEMLGDFEPNRRYDIIRLTSPLLLSRDGRYLTFKDEGFMEALNRNCKAKLRKSGFSDEAVSSVSVEPYKFENARTKAVLVHGAYSIASVVHLVVKGDSAARTALYNMGLGKSTGSGFGSVEILRPKEKCTRMSTKKHS